MNTDDAPTKPKRRLRRVLTPIIVALAILVFTATVPAAWARRTALNTDRFVELVGPSADDPAIQQSLADKVTERVMSLLDIEAVVNDVFPERGAVLEAPLTNAIEGYVHGLVLRVFESDAFTRLWTETNRFVHTEMLAVLDGGTDTVSTVGGKVALNLMPMVQLVLEQMAALVPDLIGRNITIPEIDVPHPPSEAVLRFWSPRSGSIFPMISAPSSCTSPASSRRAEGGADLRRLVIVLVLLVLVLVALALWSLPRRRRALLQLMRGSPWADCRSATRRRIGSSLESARPETRPLPMRSPIACLGTCWYTRGGSSPWSSCPRDRVVDRLVSSAGRPPPMGLGPRPIGRGAVTAEFLGRRSPRPRRIGDR